MKTEREFIADLLSQKEDSGWYVGRDNDLVLYGRMQSMLHERLRELDRTASDLGTDGPSAPEPVTP
jgi:hypothetical protein